MTNKFIYIECGSCLDESSRVYFVSVGTSRQANRDYLWLTAFSVEKGHFFEINSMNVADFLMKVYGSLPNLAQPVSISARELVRHFKNGTRPAKSATQLANFNHSMTILNLNYRAAHHRP